MPIPCRTEPSTEYAHSFHLRVERVADISVHMHNLIYRVYTSLCLRWSLLSKACQTQAPNVGPLIKNLSFPQQSERRHEHFLLQVQRRREDVAKTVTETLAMAKACLSSSPDDASSSNDDVVDDEDTKRKCGNERVKYSKDVITALSPDRRRASERESSRVSDSKPWGEVGTLSPPLSPPLYLSVLPPFRFRLSYET